MIRASSLTFVAATLLAGALARGSDADSFIGTVLLPDLSLPGGQSYRLTISIEKWTRAEEGQRLARVLEQGGEGALLKELRKLKAGYIVPPAFARQPAWPVALATRIDTREGRVVRLFTDRPISFLEAARGPRPRDDEFGAVEFALNAKGEGQGTVVPAARVVFDTEGHLAIEAWPSSGRQTMIGVRHWQERRLLLPPPVGKEKDSDQP